MIIQKCQSVYDSDIFFLPKSTRFSLILRNSRLFRCFLFTKRHHFLHFSDTCFCKVRLPAVLHVVDKVCQFSGREWLKSRHFLCKVGYIIFDRVFFAKNDDTAELRFTKQWWGSKRWDHTGQTLTIFHMAWLAMIFIQPFSLHIGRFMTRYSNYTYSEQPVMKFSKDET